MSAKLVHAAETSNRSVNRVMAKVRSLKPTQVVIWYSVPGSETGVAISDGVERVKTVGALNCMAYDVWNG